MITRSTTYLRARKLQDGERLKRYDAYLDEELGRDALKQSK